MFALTTVDLVKVQILYGQALSQGGKVDGTLCGVCMITMHNLHQIVFICNAKLASKATVSRKLNEHLAAGILANLQNF